MEKSFSLCILRAIGDGIVMEAEVPMYVLYYKVESRIFLP